MKERTTLVGRVVKAAVGAVTRLTSRRVITAVRFRCGGLVEGAAACAQLRTPSEGGRTEEEEEDDNIYFASDSRRRGAVLSAVLVKTIL